MLTIQVKKSKEDLWDSENEVFVRVPGGVLMLEHSLISISKWESKYHKPFLAQDKNDQKTADEMRYYIKCMTMNTVDPDIYNGLTMNDVQMIADYIADPMTATTVNMGPSKSNVRRRHEIITSELIYYWMVAYQIPFECEKWHLNRLLMLIQVCKVKGSEGENKMSKRDIMAQNRALNAARRAKHHSRG